jgi:hypothetical protein
LVYIHIIRWCTVHKTLKSIPNITENKGHCQVHNSPQLDLTFSLIKPVHFLALSLFPINFGILCSTSRHRRQSLCSTSCDLKVRNVLGTDVWQHAKSKTHRALFIYTPKKKKVFYSYIPTCTVIGNQNFSQLI